MAQLKNTVVQGSLKATDTIYSSTGQFQIIKAPTTSGGSTYGPGTNGQVLKSNGSSVYWATDNNNTYYAPTTAGTAGQFLKAVGGTSAPTWNNIYYSDIKPAIKKTYASTSYYATAANNAQSAFYFMNIRPNDWNKPWTVKFKVHSFCPNYSTYQSTTECTLSGRQQDIIYHNWNEQINVAHNYISMLRLKAAGYNAGLGHAVGINIFNGGNYTNSNYYRTFEVEYYECDACEVTLLEAPVLQANWSNYNTTNYNTVSNYDAANRGLRESGEENDIYTSMINYPRIVTGSSVGIGRYTLFMETADGTYQSITSTFNSTGTSHVKNSALFRPERIFYSNRSSDLAANNSTNNDNGWMHQQTSLIDLRYSTNCGKTLVGRKPVYLVGTIDANGFFSLADTWWTQTEPTEEDGYVYIYLGMAYTQDESSNLNTQYRVAFELDNPIYWYKNGKFVLYESPYLFSTSLTNTDLNTLNSANVHQRRFYSYFGVGSNGCTNLPIGDGQAFGLLSYPTASGLLTQELSSNAVTPGKWLRWYSATAGAWTDWQKVITSSGGTISGNLTLKTNLVFKCDDVTINTTTNNGNTGSSPIFRGINANDSTNTWYGQWHTAVNPDGTLNVYLNARNKKTDGTEVINSLIVGVKKDGTRYYQVSDAAAFRSALGLGSNATSSTAYLPLTGGAMTGDLDHKSSVVDASKTNNNITGTTYLSLFTTRDSANRGLGRIESIIQDNGNIGLYLYVKNYNTSGAQVEPKGILMTMNKSGALTYTISDKANFAAALEPYIYYVSQSTTTTANWRKIMLGKREMSSPNTALAAINDVVYGAQAIEAQPSTGTLRANIYRVANNVELQWNSTDSSLDFVFI